LAVDADDVEEIAAMRHVIEPIRRRGAGAARS
jgi:hypothetical protein